MQIAMTPAYRSRIGTSGKPGGPFMQLFPNPIQPMEHGIPRQPNLNGRTSAALCCAKQSSETIPAENRP